LNGERNDLVLPDVLADRYIQNPLNFGTGDIVFGEGFGGITDLTVGPDGYLYIVSIGQGKVFRILPQ
jgi:glucose/arabinose dehydrogenase